MSRLEVQGLTKRYRRVPVVNEVSFIVNAGEITGYLGPNGSGKSTTVKMLAGLVEPTAGKILLDGFDVRRDFIGFKRRLGYVPEEAHVYPALSGMEYLQLMGRLRELPERLVNEKATDLLKLFSLYLHRHAPLASYSKGMKQRVLICAKVIIIYKGQIKAEDSVVRLRDLMHVPSLEEIFTQLVQHEDMEAVAKDIAEAIRYG